MSLRLDWPGGLEAFALRHADGSINAKVGAGRLLDVEPGVGRMLGFMNLGALGRRLSLDFSDLYQQGFAFEQIDGQIRIGGGQARSETFAIQGPAGDVTIEGSSNLVEQTFDQTVTVVPRIGSSVALASALAGGPVVGAAVLLVDRVAGGAIDRLGSYRYRVTGPWREPVLERVGWEPRLGRQGPGSGTTGAGGVDGQKSRQLRESRTTRTSFWTRCKPLHWPSGVWAATRSNAIVPRWRSNSDRHYDWQRPARGRTHTGRATST